MSLDQSRAAAAKWKEEFKAPFPVLFDPRMTIAQAYGVEGIPFNVVIDRKGKLVQIIEGADTKALDTAVKQVAARKPSAK